MYTDPCPAADATLTRFLRAAFPPDDHPPRGDGFTDCIDVVAALNTLCLELDFMGYIRDDSDENNPWLSPAWQNASAWATPTERLLPVLHAVYPDSPWRAQPYSRVPCEQPTNMMERVRRHVFIHKLHALNDLLRL